MEVIYFLDLFGTFSFAVSGAILVSNKKLDLFGVFFIGFITAVGGGTIRDILIGSIPVFWMKDMNYLIVITASAFISFIFIKKILTIKNIFLIFDAIGIGVFTVIGMNKGIAAGLPPPVVIIMGITTAVMGGMLRDIICNQIPVILRKEIYATACLAGALVYYALHFMNAGPGVMYFVSMLFIIAIRLVAIRFNLSLPKIG